MKRYILAASLALLAHGCLPDLNKSCSSDDECDDGQSCAVGTCVSPTEADSATGDDAETDGAALDDGDSLRSWGARFGFSWLRLGAGWLRSATCRCSAKAVS